MKKLAKIGLVGCIGYVISMVLICIAALLNNSQIMSIISLLFGVSLITSIVCLFKLGVFRKSKLVTHIILILFFSPVYIVIALVIFIRILTDKVTEIEPVDTVFDSFKEGFDEGKQKADTRNGGCCANCKHYHSSDGMCTKKNEKTQPDSICPKWFDVDYWEKTKAMSEQFKK